MFFGSSDFEADPGLFPHGKGGIRSRPLIYNGLEIRLYSKTPHKIPAYKCKEGIIIMDMGTMGKHNDQLEAAAREVIIAIRDKLDAMQMDGHKINPQWTYGERLSNYPVVNQYDHPSKWRFNTTQDGGNTDTQKISLRPVELKIEFKAPNGKELQDKMLPVLNSIAKSIEDMEAIRAESPPPEEPAPTTEGKAGQFKRMDSDTGFKRQ